MEKATMLPLIARSRESLMSKSEVNRHKSKAMLIVSSSYHLKNLLFSSYFISNTFKSLDLNPMQLTLQSRDTQAGRCTDAQGRSPRSPSPASLDSRSTLLWSAHGARKVFGLRFLNYNMLTKRPNKPYECIYTSAEDKAPQNHIVVFALLVAFADDRNKDPLD